MFCYYRNDLNLSSIFLHAYERFIFLCGFTAVKNSFWFYLSIESNICLYVLKLLSRFQ
jgi:hypothetical protein